MGTRNLTFVKKGGEIKIAQYGQWDGYPSGQGSIILAFAKDTEKLERLRANVDKFISFMSKKEMEDFDALPDKERKEQFKAELWSRDIGGEILERVSNLTENKKLINKMEFGYDDVFCEWAYGINFDTNKLECYTDLNHKLAEYDLSNLPTEEQFIKELDPEEEN